MDWRAYYDSRLITPKQAAALISSGDTVVTGHTSARPNAILDALADRYLELENVNTVSMQSLVHNRFLEPEMRGHIRHNSLFVGQAERADIAEGNGDYTPVYFSRIPAIFKEGYIKDYVGIFELAPPDRHGYCSHGVSVDFSKSAMERARLKIAVINSSMPRTYGDCFEHVADIDYFVEVNEPILEMTPPDITPVEEAIGEYCASMVEDGATLQLGIGALPNALLKFLGGKKDLGIHSEIISDGVVDLMEAGVISNKLKTLHPGKTVVTFLLGTKKLYDYADDNPAFYMAPVDYVNDPYVISRNRKMVSINACLQVDLMGQVCSDSVGLRQISSVGGQVDFVRAVNMTPDGVSIIATPSRTKDGKQSKIVPFLDKGAAVTTNRFDVYYIVTEYGIANLRNITLRERSRRLIAIAHPDFRPMLIEEYERRYKQKF
jgi:4-hydroxybutyrate CoA-transferase